MRNDALRGSTTATLALLATLVTAPAIVVQASDSATSCDDQAAAVQYERQAAEEEAAADRFRTWASAEEMFGSGNAFGRRFGVPYYEDQARLLALAAKQNRRLADEARDRAPGSAYACNAGASESNG